MNVTGEPYTTAGVIVDSRPSEDFPYVVSLWVDGPDSGAWVRHAGFRRREEAENYAQKAFESQFRDPLTP